MKKILVINLIMFGIIAGFMLTAINFNNEALAQDNTKNLKLAVVNFSDLMKRSEDVQSFQNLLKLYNTLYQETQKDLQSKLQKAQDNLKAAQDEKDFENSQAYEEAQNEYLRILSELETLKDTMDFTKKKELVKFSSDFLEKALDTIRIYSAGRYDMVFKVINPADKDLENMDDAMQLQLDQAREILYFDADNVPDITKEISRIIDSTKDESVSKEIEAKVKEIEAEIAKLNK